MSSASTQLRSFSISSRICGPCLISIATNWHLFASIAIWLLRVFFSFWEIEIFCNLGVPGKTDFDNLKFCCWHFLISLVSVKVFLNFHFLFLISLVWSYSLSKVFSLSLFFSGLITPLPLSVKGFITFNFCFLFHQSCPTLCKRFPHSHFLFLFHHQRVPS